MNKKKRLRCYGIVPGYLPTGDLNAITDVPGVAVGHFSLTQGHAICTGVTAVLPHGGNIWQHKVPAAVDVINGFGKATGLAQLRELGQLETPIILTNTLSVGAALDGLVAYKLERNPEIGRKEPTVNGIVAECNDGFLNHIGARAITADHVRWALDSAGTVFPGEGNVGAGMGMSSFGIKGGIGTSSRIADGFVCGVLALCNFGRWHQLTIAGVPVGRLLKAPGPDLPESGSVIVIVATNAPLDSRQLGRLARRGSFGLARTGSCAGHGSGDFVISFSTAGIEEGKHAGGQVKLLPDNKMDTMFEAVVEATEEAVLNALFAAETIQGRDGNVREALPVEQVLRAIEKYRVIEGGNSK